MAEVIPNILSDDDIDYLINLPEVKAAKTHIDKQSSGNIYFSISLTPTIKSYLYQKTGMDLRNVSSVPMRWIKGDTTPHIDTSIQAFDKTHIVYLTDSVGEFIVDHNTYPITKGSAYVFSEGMSHKTVGTGTEPRLLLGPMSEQGISVGAATNILADGETEIIYIRYDVGSGTTYKINDGSYNSISLPLTITNTNTAFTLQVLFETDLVLQSNIWYIVCGSENIQFGSTSLNNDGSRPTITIDGILNYPGFIRNGTVSSNGNNNIYVYNLNIVAANGSTLVDEGGWIGQVGFSQTASNNYIVNCSSNGDISNNGGGIIGAGCAYGIGASLYIIGCSSTGAIGTEAGGIVGFAAASSYGSITCESCWSEGAIGQDAGGIFGSYASPNGTSVALNCYSTGAIDTNGGGIFGVYAGEGLGQATAQNCYSSGIIQSSGGGIFGRYGGYNFGFAYAINSYSSGTIASLAGGIYGSDAGNTSGTTSATNCYSSGSITTPGNGIYGSNKVNGTETSCNSSNGSWNSINANATLTGAPSPIVGTTWIKTVANQPYELTNMGYSPYSLTNIITTSTPNLNRNISGSIAAGQTVIPVISGPTYTLLEITGGDPSSYGTITIPDNSTGVIQTTSATVPGSYTIYVRSTGSYNITIFGLAIGAASSSTSVVSIPPCCQPICPTFNQTTNNTQQQLAVRQSAIAIASDVDSTYLAINQNRAVQLIQPAFANYRDYMTYLQSKYR